MTDIERFDVIIRHVGDGYVAGVSNLGLYTRAPTAAAALAALEARRAALSEEIEATGIVEPFPEVVASQPHPRSSQIAWFVCGENTDCLHPVDGRSCWLRSFRH